MNKALSTQRPVNTTVMPINNKYEIIIGGKAFPDPDDSTTTEFQRIAREIAKPLLLTKPVSSEMYPLFGKHVATFKTAFEQIKRLSVSIIRANADGNDPVPMNNRIAALSQKLMKIPFNMPPGLTAEVAIKPEVEQMEMLNRSITESVNALCYFMGNLLDALVLSQQVGLIEWFSPKVCRFHYYMNSYDVESSILDRHHSLVGREHTETWKEETKKTETHARHQHDLVNAKAWPLNDKEPYRPQRINVLLQDIPDLFKPHFRIVTGDQIFEHVVREKHEQMTTSSGTRTWIEPDPPRSTWQYDPAVVIGEYVIAGWDAAEEERERKEDARIYALNQRLKQEQEQQERWRAEYAKQVANRPNPYAPPVPMFSDNPYKPGVFSGNYFPLLIAIPVVIAVGFAVMAIVCAGMFGSR